MRGKTGAAAAVWLRLPAVIGVAAVIMAGAAQASGFCTSPEEIAQAAQSVFRIETYDASGRNEASGSGFVALENDILVTSCHVVVNMDSAVVTGDDGTCYQVTGTIALDEDLDIALLRLSGDFTPLVCRAELPQRGETAAVIASPLGLLNIVTSGNICFAGTVGETQLILFTAPVSKGSSGGALFNDDGEVTGVVTGTFNDTQNINVAVPIEQVIRLYEEAGT